MVRGATASTISSVCPAPSRSPKRSTRLPDEHSHATAPSRTWLFCAAIPRRVTRPSPGIANGEPSPVLRATTLGLDIRFVVTSLDVGSAEWIYDSLYCARGQAENLIKLHKTQLASDRTGCRVRRLPIKSASFSKPPHNGRS